MQNPLDGILPDFSIFGAEFTELWQKLLAGVWALGIVASIVFLILGLVKIGNNGETNPQAVAEGKRQVLWASISLGGLVSLGVIVGAIIALVS
jgi:hypothetical protein